MTAKAHRDASAVDAERVATGIEGLDVITKGGFFRSGVYMFLAPPGSGKTILANQMCFHHVARGGRVVYITLLAETHGRMIAALRPFTFFDRAAVGTSLSYLSGYDALENGKLKGLLDLVRKSVRAKEATLLVLDGLVTVGDVADTQLETKKFIHELQAFVELAGCTTLLLTGNKPGGQYPLRTMVDGLVELAVEAVGMNAVRSIDITKFRGGATLLGRHFFDISDDGVEVFPRTEARRGLTREEPALAQPALATFEIPALDSMLEGGLRRSSTTALVGAPGSGKTLLGLSFLTAGARRDERGLYFGFFEPTSAMQRRADAVGLELTTHVSEGRIAMISRSPRAAVADALAEQLFAAIRERGVRRLFVDSLDSFKDALVYPDRTCPFFGALCDELRALGVVTVVSARTESLAHIELQDHGLTAMFDNVVALGHVELGATLRKRISVVKMREGKADSTPHELTIGPDGVSVSPLGRGD